MTRWYWIASAIPVIAAFYYFVSLLLVFRHLPAQTPVHFGIDGTPNGWMNRYAWAAVSLVMLAVMISVVYATKPIMGGSATAAWIYWVASGLVIGSFVQVNRAAAARHNLQFWPAAIWSLVVPLLEFLLVKAAGSWLRGQ